LNIPNLEALIVRSRDYAIGNALVEFKGGNWLSVRTESFWVLMKCEDRKREWKRVGERERGREGEGEPKSEKRSFKIP